MAYIAVTEINSTTCWLQVVELDTAYQYYRDYDWQVVNELTGRTVATNLQQTTPGVSSSPVWQVSGLTPSILYSVTCQITRSDAAISLATLTATFTLEDDDSGSSGGDSSGDDDEEEENYFSKRRVVSTNITSSKSSSTTTPAYSIDYIRVKVSQASQIDVRVEGSEDICLYYKLGTTSSNCNASISNDTTPVLNWSKMIDKKSSGAETTSFTMMDGDSYAYAEIGWYEYDGYEMDVDYEITITPLVTNYTITYALGTANKWSDGTTENKTQTKPSTSNISLYGAIGVKNSVITTDINTYTFNGNGATTQNKYEETSNQRTAYTHTSWNTSSGGGGTTYALGETYSTNSSKTLYPIFTSSVSYTQVYFPTANECQRTNYTLLGWSSRSDATSADFLPGDALKGNHATKTWYAVWQADTYQYTLNTASHVTIQADATPTGTYAPGTTIVLAASVEAGYSFVQWTSSNPSLVSHKKTSATSFPMPSGNITMTPEVVLSTYTIMLNLNDGSETIVSEYTINSLPTVGTPSRIGYTFLGWTGSNGTTPEQTVTISANDLGDKIYTANWQANTYTYNISCVSKSGKNLQVQSIDGVFDTTNLVTPPEITGYTTPSSQNVVWDSVNAKQIEFVYEPIEYTLSINYNNGTPYISDTYTIESGEKKLQSQSRNGYAFCGWTGTEITSPQETVTISSGSIGDRSYVATWAQLIVFNFKNSDTDLLKNATNTQGIAINWYVSQSQIQDFINKINNYCSTSITLSEWQTLDNYNAIVDALNQSSAPNHFSGTTQPKLTKKSEDDYIKAQDLLDLENAFNNRKFI